MTDAALTYVVMLTYNNCTDTLEALDFVVQMTYPNYRVLVVDNGSSDGTPELVRSRFPGVEVLENSRNLGFSAGNNRGIECALARGADFVLIINNDVIVRPSLLTMLVEAMDPGVGATAPMILYWDDPTRIWSVGFGMHPTFLVLRGGARGQVDQGQWAAPFEVDSLLGCAMLLRGTMLEDIGLFDERFFFYYEDLDLCLRARRNGYRLLTVPAARMWHKVAGSAGMGSAFRVYQMARGDIVLFRAHARGLQWSLGALYRAASGVKKTIQFSLGGRLDLLKSYWRGVWDGWQTA